MKTKNWGISALFACYLALTVIISGGCSDPFGFQAEADRLAQVESDRARMKAEKDAKETERLARIEIDRFEREKRAREWAEEKVKKDEADRERLLVTIPAANVPDMSRLYRMSDAWNILTYDTCRDELASNLYGYYETPFCRGLTTIPEVRKLDVTTALQSAEGLLAVGRRYEAALLYADYGKQDKAREIAVAMNPKSADWVAVSHIAAVLGDEALLFEAMDHGVRDLNQITRSREKVLDWLITRGLPELATKVAERYNWSGSSIRIYRTRALQYRVGSSTPSWAAAYATEIEKIVAGISDTGRSDDLDYLTSDVALLSRMNPYSAYKISQVYLGKSAAVLITNERCGEGCYYSDSRGTVELLLFLLNYERNHKIDGPKASDLYLARAAEDLALLHGDGSTWSDYFVVRDQFIGAQWNAETKKYDTVPRLRENPTVWELLTAVKRTGNGAAIGIWSSALEGLTKNAPACREFGRLVLGAGVNLSADDLDDGSKYVLGRITGLTTDKLPNLTDIPLGDMPRDEQPSCSNLGELRGIGAFLAPYDGTVQEMLERAKINKD